jgi:putative PEP-CTERM system TPR-repeat lipoprotein
LAVARASKNEEGAALRELEEITASTDGIEADLKLISARLARDELDLADKAIEALNKKQPDRPASFELRGQLKLKQGNPDGARKAFETALQKDKYYLPAVAQLTNLDIEQRAFDQARKRLKDFQLLDPGNAAVLVAMAGLEVRAGGSSALVIELLTKATKANPRDVGAWKTLIGRHLVSGDTPGALSTAQTAVAAVPDNVDLMDALARAQVLAGDTRQASGVYANIIRIAPQSPTGYLGLAALQSRNGELDAAASTLKRLLTIDERSVEAQRLAVELALKRRQMKEALAIAANLQRQYPDDSFGYRLEGDIEFEQTRWDAAAAAYRKGLQKQEPEAVAQGLHAALQKGGRQIEADKAAADWLKTHPKDTSFIGYLGDTALKTKDYALARKAL